MRHMMNLEAWSPMRGTHDIHLLIAGAEVTGIRRSMTNDRQESLMTRVTAGLLLFR